MNIVERVKNILLKPREEWVVIDSEATDTASLFTRYLMILALVPVAASFVGLSLLGVGAMGMSMRVPLVDGLVSAAVGYVVSLAGCVILALIVDAAAPSFGGQKSRLNAFKLVAYGSTAALVGGIFNLLPSIAVLGLLAALYSIYLIYTGLPVLMKCPAEKAAGYTATVVVVAIVIGIVAGAVTSAAMSVAGGRGGGVLPMSEMTFSTPEGKVSVNPNSGGGVVTVHTDEGKMSVDIDELEKLGKQAEALAEKLEAAQQSGSEAEGSAGGKAGTEP